MNKLILLLSLVSSLASAGELVKIGLIDTGLQLSDPRFKNVLCKDGHKDFTNTTLDDNDGHGTHVAGIIKQYAGEKGYCLIIYKFYDSRDTYHAGPNETHSREAFFKAIADGVKLINYSAGGRGFMKDEYELIKSHPEVKIVVAAGNNSEELDCIKHDYYPACYKLKNIFPVGSLNESGQARSDFSNYGELVKYWHIGELIFSTLPNNKNGYMSGTSMSAAQQSAVEIRKLIK